MFASQSAPKVLLDLNEETIFTIALKKNRTSVAWEAKDILCIFGIIIPNWLSKVMQGVCNLVFHILWELRVQILKNHENKSKRPLLKFVSMSLICAISNGMFLSQSAPCPLYALFQMECSFPKVLLELNKNIGFVMELYKLHKIERKSSRSGLRSKTQSLYFWNNYLE